MSALLEAIIPDSIEPVEAFRCWTLRDDGLRSLNGGGVGETWTPGEPLAAKCNANHGQQFEWRIVRSGKSREAAEQALAEHRHMYAGSMYSFGGHIQGFWPSVPAVEPPAGYGFEIAVVRHEAPDEDCTCGIYAAIDDKGVPDSGNVYGKVKLWGKVVPGEKGYRAQYAYPTEFRVAPKFVDHPALLAFGVPIIADEKLSTKAEIQMKASAAAFGSAMSSMSASIGSVSFAFGSQRRPLWKRILVSPWTMGLVAVANLASIGVNLFVR